jgi:hypothetical protein
MLPPDGRASSLVEPALRAVVQLTEDETFADWATAMEENGRFAAAQRGLFRQLQEYVRAWEGWAPGFIVRATQEELRPELDELHIARDDFPRLRDLYVQTFETCSQALWVPMGMMNSQLRHGPEAFGPVPAFVLAGNARATAPRSLRDFEHLANATKIRWLVDWSSWDDSLPQMLDSRLRNALGHADARHDVHNGRVITGAIELSYLDFTALVFDLAIPLLTLLQVIKSCRLIAADHAGVQGSTAPTAEGPG